MPHHRERFVWSRWLWRHRRWLGRGVEALAAVICLIVCHQAAWLVVRDYTGSIQWSHPNRVVWLRLAESSGDDDPKLAPPHRVSEGGESVVLDPYVRIAVAAPPGESVTIAVDGAELGSGPIPGGSMEVSVPLRPGPNRITAALTADPRAGAELFVVHRLASPPPPEVLGVVEGAGGWKLLGLAPPDSPVEIELAGSPPRTVSTDLLGLFAVDLPPELPPVESMVRLTTLTAGPSAVIEISSSPPPGRPGPEVGDVQIVGAGSDRPTQAPSGPDSASISVPRGTLAPLELARKLEVGVDEDGTPRLMLEARGLRPELVSSWLRLDPDYLIHFLGGVTVLFPDLAPPPQGVFPRPVVESLGNGVRVRWKGTPRSGVSVRSLVSTALPLLSSSGDVVRLELPAAAPLIVVRPPTATEEGAYHWTGIEALPDGPTIFHLEPGWAPTGPTSTLEIETPKTLRGLVELLRRLQSELPERSRVILGGLLAALPLIILLWLLSRYPASLPSHIHRTLEAVVATLLVFHAGVLSVPVFSASFEVVEPLLVRSSYFEAAFLLRELGRVYPVSLLGIALLLGPIYRAMATHDTAPGWLRRTTRRLLRWLLFWPGVVAVPAVFVALLVLFRHPEALLAGVSADVELDWAAQGPPGASLELTVVVLALGLAVLWFFLYWMLRAVLGKPIRVRGAVRASWAALLFPLLPPALDAAAGAVKSLWLEWTGIYPFFLPREPGTLAWALIIAGIGAALLYQLTELAVRLVRSPAAFRFLRSPWHRLLMLLYLLLCLPLGWVLGGGGRRVVDVWDLAQLAFQLDDLVPPLALLGVVLLMRRGNPGDRFDVPHPVRLAGVLAFAYYVVGFTANIWFVPIPLLVGWVLFDRWVLRRSPPPVAPGSVEAAGIVRRLLDYRQAQRLADQLPKQLEKLLGEGKTTLGEVRAALAQARNHAARALERLPGGVDGARNAAFAYGPGSGPWDNAMTALRYGAVIAVPFQLLALFPVLRDTRIGNFPFVQIVSVTLDQVLWWLVLAFVFGFFFHLIRGRDGFGKAMVVVVAVLVASIPYRLLNTQPLFEVQHFAESLQILLFVLLVALFAFDLRILRELGFRRRDFLAVHGLTTVAGYASSIALTAIGAYLSKDLGSLIATLFRHLAGATGGG